MLERVIHPRHFHELDLAIEIAVEPQLLEMADVPEIPEDRTHQRIMLRAQIGFGHNCDQLQRARARFRKRPA